MELLKWQEEALDRLKLLKQGNGLALWCDTGLGKGVFGAYVAEIVGDTLIICPPHLISDWVEKLHTKVNIITKDNKLLTKGTNIISFNKFQLYADEIGYEQDKFFLIIDEAHKVKNFKGSTTQAVLNILPRTKAQLLLSATFQTKNNTDLFSIAYICNSDFRDTYDSFWSFGRVNVEYKNIYVHKRVIEQPVRIYPNAMEQYIKPNFFMATYESTGIKRPESLVIDVKVESNKKIDRIVKAIEKEELLALTEGIEIENLTASEYQKLLNLLANPHSKFAQISNNIYYGIEEDKYITYNYRHKISLVKSIIISEKEHNHKGLLFYFYKVELEQIKKAKLNAYYYDSSKDTQKQIKEFEKGKFDIFVANYASLGEGVRFKKSNYLIEFTLIYDYARVLQARGRLQYVGRKDTYKIYHLQLQHNIVDNLVNNIGKKVRSIKETRDLLEV